jgi:hypothetical protein
VHTEVRTVLRAVMTAFLFNCCVWRSLRITVFGTYQGVSTIMRKTLAWKRSRISMFEVEAAPHNCIPWVQIGLSIALYMRI